MSSEFKKLPNPKPPQGMSIDLYISNINSTSDPFHKDYLIFCLREELIRLGVDLNKILDSE